MFTVDLKQVLSHWSKLFERLSVSPQQFYSAVEEGLKGRQLQVSTRRVEWEEGGLLSPRREYLCVEGGGCRFDLCAAPFGTGSFFSWWLRPRKSKWTDFYLALFLACTVLGYQVAFRLLFKLFNQPAEFPPSSLAMFLLAGWPTALLTTLYVLFIVVALLARAGRTEAEEAILTVPLLRWLYQPVFAPATFYRLDTAEMFRTSVHQAVLEAIDALTTQKGIRALAPEERRPTLNRLG